MFCLSNPSPKPVLSIAIPTATSPNTQDTTTTVLLPMINQDYPAQNPAEAFAFLSQGSFPYTPMFPTYPIFEVITLWFMMISKQFNAMFKTIYQKLTQDLSVVRDKVQEEQKLVEKAIKANITVTNGLIAAKETLKHFISSIASSQLSMKYFYNQNGALITLSKNTTFSIYDITVKSFANIHTQWQFIGCHCQETINKLDIEINQLASTKESLHSLQSQLTGIDTNYTKENEALQDDMSPMGIQRQQDFSNLMCTLNATTEHDDFIRVGQGYKQRFAKLQSDGWKKGEAVFDSSMEELAAMRAHRMALEEVIAKTREFKIQIDHEVRHLENLMAENKARETNWFHFAYRTVMQFEQMLLNNFQNVGYGYQQQPTHLNSMSQGH
ncbi:hypothetical protein HDU76_000406 [Blyttiomyces sp. JEL0837]|nr:hypothetical protein HDU76_000406 [Blyttiomyces sp. JEL0837]